MPFDPYERAAERAAAAERTAREAARPADEPPDALEVRAPRNIVRKVMFGLVVLLFLGAIAVTRRPPAPAVSPDCARAAFQLSTAEVEQNRPVAYTIVGPDGREYALGVDTRTFERGPDGRWTGVPKAGFEQTFLEAAPAARMAGCKREGLFSTPIPLGTHSVTLYELTERGAVFVTEQRLEVTEP